MAISVFDLFKVGIGPSSSHTVGPMIAASWFADALIDSPNSGQAVRIKTDLLGSLGATGKGHGSDKAVLLGLCGEHPETVDVETIDSRLKSIRDAKKLVLKSGQVIQFDEKADLIMHRRKSLPFHPNAVCFEAFDKGGTSLLRRTYYSVGGGFVLDEKAAEGENPIAADDTSLPYPFTTGEDILVLSEQHNKTIAQMMMANECIWREEADVRSGLLNIWHVMQECVQRGCQETGVLPGGMKVRRRAADMHQSLLSAPEAALKDPLTIIDWVNLYALAVNEENAAGGRVVTAPTNGAAGIIPAVLHYYIRFIPGANDDGVIDFLLTATGGSTLQIENAAEIGMEHNLGLTCDPVGGLVQVPCIERNAMASVKAINAARKTKYKETARGGLAVNVIEVPVSFPDC